MESSVVCFTFIDFPNSGHFFSHRRLPGFIVAYVTQSNVNCRPTRHIFFLIPLSKFIYNEYEMTWLARLRWSVERARPVDVFYYSLHLIFPANPITLRLVISVQKLFFPEIAFFILARIASLKLTQVGMFAVSILALFECKLWEFKF